MKLSQILVRFRVAACSVQRAGREGYEGRVLEGWRMSDALPRFPPSYLGVEFRAGHSVRMSLNVNLSALRVRFLE